MSEANWNALKPVILYSALILLPCFISAWFFDIALGNWIVETTWAQNVLIWVLFSLFSAWFEAHYYDAKTWSNMTLKIDEHIIWNGIRFFVWLPLLISDWQTGLCLVGLFPFIHDGKYYSVRHKLLDVIYNKGFWSNPSNTSTAIVDINIWVRSAIFLLSVILILILKTDLL